MNGNAQVFQPDNVALHGAQVYFQALGQLRSRYIVARLQDLEHREHAHDGVVHRNLILP